MRGESQGATKLWRHLGAIVSALGFAALAAPAAASGELIYTAPDDQSSGFFCSQSQPCGLVVGINLVAEDNDEVVLAPGTYATDDELEVMNGDNDVTIRPRDPGTRPVIASTANTALRLSGLGGTVRGIEIQHDNPASPGLFALAFGTRIHNVISRSNGDTPCQVANTRLTDTICEATAAGSRALRISIAGGAGSSIVRNATLVSTASNSVGIYATSSGTGTTNLNVASTIISGVENDVEATTTGGTAVTAVTIANSNFESVDAPGGAIVTPATSNGNQTAAPSLVLGTYEQVAGSPTIDAGFVDAETGATDVYGDARPQGAANDIGADELAVVPPPDTTPPETSITKKPKKRTSKRGAKFAFASSEPGSTFECKVDKGGYEACGSSLKLKKLKRRKHTLAVRAVDAAGNVDATPATHAWKVKKKKKK